MDNPFAAIYGSTPTAVAPAVNSSNPFASIYGGNQIPKSNPIIVTLPVTGGKEGTINGQQAFQTPSGSIWQYTKDGIRQVTLAPQFGGGAYSVNPANPSQPVNTGHSNYGGVAPVKGMQRNDIIPTSLGGLNSNSFNIALQSLGQAKAQDKIETQTAAEVKSGKLPLGQARLQALTRNQQPPPQTLGQKVGQALGFSEASYAPNPFYATYKALIQPSEGSKQVEQAGEVAKLPLVAKQIAQGAIRLTVPGIEQISKQIGVAIGTKGKELPSGLDAFVAGGNAGLVFASVGAIKLVSDILGATGDTLVNTKGTVRITPDQLRTKLVNGEIQTPQAQALAREFIQKGQTLEVTSNIPRGGVAQTIGETIGGEIKPPNFQIKGIQTEQPISGQLANVNEQGVPTSNPLVEKPTKTSVTPQTQIATINENGFPTSNPIIPIKSQETPPVTPQNAPGEAITPKVGESMPIEKTAQSLLDQAKANIPTMDNGKPMDWNQVNDWANKIAKFNGNLKVGISDLAESISYNKRGLPQLLEDARGARIPNALPDRLKQVGILETTKPIETPTEKPVESTTLNAEIIPGLSKTIEQDIIPKAKSIASSAKELYNFVATAFNPVGQAPSKAVDILMTKKGEMEKALFQTEQATKEINKMWDKQPELARLDFMQKVETGQAVDPAFHDLTQMYRERLDNAYQAIEKYKDIPFLENFFPHFWEKPGQITSFLSKRPLAGTKSFLKQRVFETIQEGIDAGYKPVTTNPEQLMQIYEQNVRKFVTAQEIKQDMIDKGFWKFVKVGEKAPVDFARIEDSIARVYFPQKLEGGKTTIAQGGEYYVQKDVARLINNFLSKDLIRDTPIGRGLMNAKNTLNAFQLGFSAFHLTMETLDTVVSKFSIGVSKIVSGKPLEGLADILKAPAAPVNYFRAGQKFFNGDPELRKIENDLFTGGAKLGASQYFKNTVFDTFTKNAREGNYIGALVRSPMAIIEGTMRPLFSYYIPRLKVGAFRDLFASELQRNSAKIQSGELTQEQVARDVWNNIENRMGELNYDNLFWNKNLKGALMLTFRAVGWNLGTVRELGGGIFQDLPSALGKGVTGKGFDFTPKMSYTFSLFLVMGMIGAIYQYLHTGKKPTGFKDLYYPMNGEKDINGDDYRIEFPSYLKDLYQYSHNPIQTVGNKLAPEFTTIIDLLQNKDFFGDYIRNTNDNLPTQTKQVAAYLASNFTPFTLQQIRQQQKGQAKVQQEVEAFFGLIKAPAAVIQSDKTKAIYQALQDKMGARGAQTPEQKEITALKAQARLELQKGDETTLNKLKAMGVIKPGASEKAFRKAAQLTPAERANQSLPKAQRK